MLAVLHKCNVQMCNFEMKTSTPHFSYVVAASKKLEPKDKVVHSERKGDQQQVDDSRTNIHQPRTHRETMVQAYGEYKHMEAFAFAIRNICVICAIHFYNFNVCSDNIFLKPPAPVKFISAGVKPQNTYISIFCLPANVVG